MNSNASFQPTRLPEDFKVSIMKYLKYWYVFLISIVVSLAAAFIYLNTATPSYKVSSTLLVQDDKKGDGELKGSAFNDLNMFRTDKKVDNEMEVLRSRDLIYKVLKSLSLETSYFQKDKWKEKELYDAQLPVKVIVITLSPVAYEKKIAIAPLNDHSFYLIEGDQKWSFDYGKEIKRTGFHLTIERGPASWESTEPIRLKFNNLYNMAESYSLKKLSVLPVIKDANTVILSLQDAVPQRGIDILTTLIKTYNEENVTRKNIIAVNTINFIDKRLAYLSKDLSFVEQDVERYKQAHMVTDLSADAQANVMKSGEYQQLKANSEVQLRVIESLQNYLSQPDNQFSMVPSSLTINNLTLNELSSKFNAVQQERNRMLRTSNLNNPLVLNLTDQLNTLKQNIVENLQNIKQGMMIERNNLASMSSQFNQKIRSAPVVERGLLERSREQGVKMSLYHYLLQKREETTLSLSGTVPTSQVIDQPAYHSIQVSPKTQLSYLFAFFFGCFIPAAVIYSKSFLNNKITDAKDIEALTGVRLLGILNHVSEKEKRILENNSRTTISELFRYIRSNLHFMSSGLPNQVLLVTSCMQAEGKTFFSLNLGMTLAAVQKKVVLLEFDLRKPDLLERMKMSPGPGITEYLKGEEIELRKLLRPSGISPNLYIIGCGQPPDNPSEMLLNPEIGALIRQLKEEFDYVIMDTSPVGQVADAFSLAHYADASIYLVRYNYTDRFHLNILRDIYENGKLNNPMVVFNDAKNDHKQSYGYGYTSYPLRLKS
ncbi:GumC family protein [Pedobacter gandavensis]|uniref:GumC family protein n=1 Tax=Pedobacter gandavensis TaxID=2679963 RepID=UPI00292E7F20|nr:Wzz/FepE/Etk N-terminal domain-containing protein [Pedobacter gandavensis]